MLSGRFCCLGVSGVVFAVWPVAFFFAVWAAAGAPPKQQKQKNATAQTTKKTRPLLGPPKQQKKNTPLCPDSKKKTRPAPSSVSPQQNLMFSKKRPPAQTALSGRWRVFLLFGRGEGGGRACCLKSRLGSCVFFFCCLGWGHAYFCGVWERTGVHLLLLVSLARL